MRQENGSLSMQPATIVCDYRVDAAAKPCPKLAVIRNIRYEYQSRFALNAGPLEQELVAIQFEIECPRCGRRTKVVAA
jgi:hypothetical protein